jgi:hypothetical protein
MWQRRVSDHPSLLSATIILMLAFILATTGCGDGGGRTATAQEVDFDSVVDAQARQMVLDGRQIFRFDTFGDETFWGGTLQLHQAIAGAPGGGVGPGLSPVAALGLGLKVDVDALPPELVTGLTQGTVDLNNPANTLALLN